MSEKQVKDYDKFVVRLPEGMREAIADRAKRNGRSMNAEIVQILQDALTNSLFGELATKENLEKMPEKIRHDLIVRRTMIARVRMAEALRDIEENLELLNINGDDIMGATGEAWWKNHDAKTIEAIVNKWKKTKKPI